MSEQKYLIAIALAEQNSKRIMPIGGKTITTNQPLDDIPKKDSEKIMLELLIRLFQRSLEGNISINSKDCGLLIAQISFKDMQENIPLIKSEWINNGDTNQFIKKLDKICSKLLTINHKKYEGIIFNSLKK
tara:strand:+ start:213 stop:605 length:393 start_codon:yes stop_codon:yes gene_type:complete